MPQIVTPGFAKFSKVLIILASFWILGAHIDPDDGPGYSLELRCTYHG